MHEMAIVQGILDIAFTEAGKHSAVRVSRIKIRIGEMSGVVSDSIEFAFEVLTKGTPAEDASLEIEAVPLKAACPGCGLSQSGSGGLVLICRKCGKGMQIVSGREMKVEYIDIE